MNTAKMAGKLTIKDAVVIKVGRSRLIGPATVTVKLLDQPLKVLEEGETFKGTITVTFGEDA